MNNRCIDHGALAQQQTTVAQIAIDDLQNPTGQLMFLQQSAEIEDRGFVRNPIQVQSCKLSQNCGFVERFFHGRIAVAEPVLHQMNPQHRHQRIGRATTFALWIVWFGQFDQAIPGQDLIHLDQEAFTAGLFAFASVFGVSEGHLLIGTQPFSGRDWRISPDLEVFFRVSLARASTSSRGHFQYKHWQCSHLSGLSQR